MAKKLKKMTQSAPKMSKTDVIEGGFGRLEGENWVDFTQMGRLTKKSEKKC